MLLYEFLLKEVEGSEPKELDYLEEYLVVAETITIKEAKELLTLVEQMHQDVEKQVQGRLKKALSSLTKTYNEKIAAARKAVAAAKAEGKSAGYIKKLSVKADNLKQEFGIKKANIYQRFKNVSKELGNKASKSKNLIKLKALKMIPKTKGGKIGAAAGVAAAGIAAAGLGYGAYKMHKAKKA